MEEDYEVAYARSTWRKVKTFHQGLRELEDKVPMAVVRNYVLTGEKNSNIPEEVYEKIDELKDVRTSGIQAEMQYAVSQAELNGIRLKDKILNGEDIRPGFSPKVLRKIPSLGIYTHFMWYTEKELERMHEDSQKSEGLKLEEIEVNNEKSDRENNNPRKEVEDDAR